MRDTVNPEEKKRGLKADHDTKDERLGASPAGELELKMKNTKQNA